MRIAEMEAHHDEYCALEGAIGAMLENRNFPDLFSACEASFPHIVPAIKFRKRRDIRPETPRLLSLQVIFKYAPALFAHAVLESLFEFVKSTRLLAKHENGYLERTARALEDEEMARSLWNHLEGRPASLQRDIGKELGLSQDGAVAILELWAELGVIGRRQEKDSYAIHFRSPVDATTEGICESCGARAKGRKELFFKPISCQECGEDGYYHIIYTSHE